jgi:hypothetical protein
LSDEKKLSAEESDFLGLGQVRLHPILSNEEVLAARQKARDRLDKERRTAALRDVEERELQRLRVEEGLTSGITEEDALRDITIDLPEWVPGIFINGQKAYYHGFSYKVSTHIFRTLAEQMRECWRTHDQTEGKDFRLGFRQRRNTNLNGVTGVIQNAPARFDA